MDRTELTRPQAQTKNDRQLRNSERRRNRLPQGRAQPVIQYQRSALKTHIHKAALYRLCLCIYKQTEEKEATVEREPGGHMGGFGERKGKGGKI